MICKECGHDAVHGKYGCEYERGDAWVTGNQPSQPTVLMAQGPCGCKIGSTDLAISGYIRLRFPDGTERRDKLPSSMHTKLGGRYIHMTVWGEQLLMIYMTRVPGGWRVDHE